MSSQEFPNNLVIPQASAEYIAHVCSMYGSRTEIGGIGLGSYDENADPVIMGLLPPGPEADLSAVAFTDDVDFVNVEIENAKNRYGLSPLCFWHVHPGKYSDPSPVDLRQCINFTKRFRLPSLGYMILTREEDPERRPQRFGKWLPQLIGQALPIVTIHSYVFHADQSQYEPCRVKVSEFSGIQQEILNSAHIPTRYRISPTYPPQKLKIINEVKPTASIPASLNAALQRLMELTPPDLIINGNILSAERVFDDDWKLLFRFQLEGDEYTLIEASVYAGKKRRDITHALQSYRQFDHAYLAACSLVASLKEGER